MVREAATDLKNVSSMEDEKDQQPVTSSVDVIEKEPTEEQKTNKEDDNTEKLQNKKELQSSRIIRKEKRAEIKNDIAQIKLKIDKVRKRKQIVKKHLSRAQLGLGDHDERSVRSVFFKYCKELNDHYAMKKQKYEELHKLYK